MVDTTRNLNNINYYTQTLVYQLGELKHVFDRQDNLERVSRVAAYERLAEISKIMRIILDKYSTFKSKELLINASQLVKAVKTYDYGKYSPENHRAVLSAIDATYASFQTSIANCFIQDSLVHQSSMAATSSSMHSKTIPISKVSVTSLHSSSSSSSPNHMTVSSSTTSSKQLSNHTPEEIIFIHESGVDQLLKQAKDWYKYLKEICLFIEKRIQVQSEYNRNIVKNSQNLKSTIQNLQSDKAFLPLYSVYNSFLEKEALNANVCIQNLDLLAKNILNPIVDFRIDLDRRLKKIREDWIRENRHLDEAYNSLAKNREIYSAKVKDEEIKGQKTKLKDDSHYGDKKLFYNEKYLMHEKSEMTKSMMAVNSQQEHFRKTKRDIINCLQNLLTIIEMKVKEITTHYLEMLKDSLTYSPEEIQEVISGTGQYDSGESFREFVKSLTLPANLNFNQALNNNNNNSMKLTSSNNNHHYMAIGDSSESDNNQPLNQGLDITSISSVAFKQQHRSQDNTSKMIEKETNRNKMVIGKKYKSVYGYPGVSTTKTQQNNQTKIINKQAKRCFGVSLISLSSNQVPDIIKQCIKQIEMRGIGIQGIYRVSAVKSHVDNLCHDIESSAGKVDLSAFHPNVIANVLKHFFRNLPEPLLTFQLYSELIAIATKYSKNQSEDDNEKDDIIMQLKMIVSSLPTVHYNTLGYLMRHLKEVSKDSEYNQMNPSNLGIVFGPTLLKKSNNDDTTLLYDTNHQGRIIELLIIYCEQVFDFDQIDSKSLSKTNSFNSNDKIKSNMIEKRSIQVQSSTPTNNDTNNYRLPKSATCSSLRPDLNQSKQEMTEARMKFFNLNSSATNQSQQNSKWSNKSFTPSNTVLGEKFLNSSTNNQNNETIISPFTKIAASSSVCTSSFPYFNNQNNRIKRVTSASQYQILNHQNEKPKIYNKHNELSKSSSEIYSNNAYKNMAIKNTNEDLV